MRFLSMNLVVGKKRKQNKIMHTTLMAHKKIQKLALDYPTSYSSQVKHL